MDVTELRQLVDYHYWARDRLLVAVERLSPDDFTRDLGSSFHSVRDTLVHLYSAERIWCARWQEQPPRAAAQAGGFADVASLRTAWRDLEAEVRAVTERFVAAGIDRVVPYRDLKGHPWEGVFWQTAAARGQPRLLSSRAGDHDAAAAAGGAGRKHGSDHVLPPAEPINAVGLEQALSRPPAR